MTPIIFRFWNLSRNIIAILPTVSANYGCTMMYEHVGQHGEGAYPSVMSQSRPATPEEYKDLFDELQGIYGDLKIVKRDSYKFAKARWGNHDSRL